MRAGVSSANGLQVQEVQRPIPTDDQVLVQVLAAGINRADLNAAKGAGIANPESLGKPIGMEWAGRIVDAGKNVKGFRVGENVLCTGTGGYAEYAVADWRRVIPYDESNISTDQAAVLPLALMTAHDALISKGRLSRGDAVLVQGASSAVGIVAMQIARLCGASLVVGTSGDSARRSQLATFGADLGIDPKSANWPKQILDRTNGVGVNIVIDMVAGDVMNLNMQASSVCARIVNVGRLGGAQAQFDFDLHALKRIEYVGVTFRTRSIDEVQVLVQAMKKDIWEHVQCGKLSLPIDRSFSLDRSPEALQYMKENRHFGKIVIKP